MPEETPIENPTPKKKSRNERTEAKFLEDVNRFIAETERLGAEYTPPSAFAATVPLKAKRDAVWVQRTVHQAGDAKLENDRNKRELLYKLVRSDVGSLVEYAKAAGAAQNDIDALKTIYRELRGERAGTAGANSISVSHQSFASLADIYARFIEQYETLNLKPIEAMYKTQTHRDKLAALRQANADVIQSEANTNTSGEMLDKLTYTDADSLLNGCVAGKSYIKSKYKTTGEPYKNISKTSFRMPSRLR